MLELAMSTCRSLRSLAMVMLNYVQDQSEHLVTLQKAIPADTQIRSYQWWKRIPAASIRNVQNANKAKIAYQDMNATMNPNHANVNTLPYTLAGLSAGIERAFWLTGFTSGAFHKSLTSSIFAGEREVSVDDSSSTSYQGGLTDQEKLGLSFSKTTSMVFKVRKPSKSNPFNPEQSCNDPSGGWIRSRTTLKKIPRSQFCG